MKIRDASRATKLTAAYVAVFAVVACLYLAGPLHAGATFVALSSSAAVAAFIGARLARSYIWLLFAIGQTLFAVGDWVDYLGYFSSNVNIGFADVWYVSVYPFFIAAGVISLRRHSNSPILGLIVGSVAVGWTLAVLVSVIGTVFTGGPEATLPTGDIAALYPILDIVIIGLLVTAWLARLQYFVLVMGFFSLLATDMFYWAALHSDGYSPGSLLDAGWLVYYVLFGTAGLLAVRRDSVIR